MARARTHIDPLAGAQELRTATRRLGTLALVIAGAVWVAWLGFRVQSTGDYAPSFAPAMNALLAGHLTAFFAQLPADGAGGSLLLRAPAAALGKLLVGDRLAVFRFGALGCVLCAGAVGLVLARGMRRAGRPAIARAAVIGLFVLVPGLLDAIAFGHPEEALGAALCIAAVLLAGDDRPELAGLALGLAIVNKPWGVIAILPTLLAARRRPLGLAAIAAGTAGLWLAAGYIASPSHFGRVVLGASAWPIAHPVDLWWPLAHLRAATGVIPTYYAPQFIAAHGRQLAAVLPTALATALLRRRPLSVEDCLALLALLFLARCLLDPDNHVYYQVPFVLALAAWEARTRGMPVLALLATAGFWFVFHTVSGTGSLTAQYVAYLALTLPLIVVLVRVVLRGEPRTGGVDAPPRLALA